MGMDVYGNKPTMMKSKNDFPIYAKYDDMPWDERDKNDEWKKDKDKFYEELTEYEAVNPGVYFRNNCWWWRPLWDYCFFVSRHYKLNAIDDELHDSGHSNSGAGLEEGDAIKLAIHLNLSIEDGTCEKYAEERQEYLDSLEDTDCSRCNNNNRGNYKKKDCHSCDKTGKREHFSKSYPFNIDNVKEFALFCQYSGGFKIY